MWNCKICGKVFKTKSNYAHHIKKCNEQENKEILKLYYEDLLSAGKIIKMGYNKSTVEYLIKNNKRSLSQQMKIFYHKNSRKVSEQTRQRIRDGRKKYMSMQRTNEWRRNKQTYIEKIFSDIIERNSLSEKFDIIREYSIFPYYLDFAFLNIKLDVEIDGSQHIFCERQKQIDIKRNEKLIKLGWKVFRIPGFKLKNEFEQIEKQFLEYLDSFDLQPKLYNFSECVIEYYKFKKIKEKQDQEQKLKEKQIIKKLKEETIKKKLQMILENSDITKRGWITSLSKKLKVSRTYIRRFLRLNFPEIDKQTYFKPRTSVKKYQNCDWKTYYSKQLLVSPHSDTV
jgi:very-short-patch-repair endonuclease